MMESRGTHCIISWNAAGLFQHYPELFHYIDTLDDKPLAICIQESHLYCRDIPTIPGYSCYDNPRCDSIGGGTTIYINNDYSFNDSLTFINNNENFIEGNSASIRLDSTELNISNFYIPPNKIINKHMLDSLKLHENHLLLGDFNAKSTIWGSPARDARGRLLEDFIEENELVCLNDGTGTFLTSSGNISHLDLALARGRIPSLVEFKVLSDGWGSDHYPVVITLSLRCSITPRHSTNVNFHKADWAQYKLEIHRSLTTASTTPVQGTVYTDSVKSRYESLLTCIEKAKDVSIPKVKQSKNKKCSPFWTGDCKNAVTARRKAERLMRRHQTEELKLNYKKCKAKVRIVIKEAKHNYWLQFTSNLQRDSNLSYIWRMVKSINGKTNNKPDSYRNLISDQIKDNTDIAQAFSVTFQKISSNENIPVDSINSRSKIINLELDKINNKNVSDSLKHDIAKINSPFTIIELKEALGSCKLKTAAGPDNVSYRLLLNLPDSGLIFLLDMINLSWSSGEIPSSWKTGFVKPILKANKKSNEFSSYRPITLSNTIPKVMERLVVYRVSWFLTKHQLINANQNGFQRGHQTVDQVYRLVREARCSIDNGDLTVAVLIDFSSAFDLVWIDAVIIKLIQLNFSGHILKWIKSFLENRHYSVKIDDCLSNQYLLDNGTPQGSSLSPWLFLIMVNDFPKLSPYTSSALFADDSSIWRSGTNIQHISHHIQSDLVIIGEWCLKWGFKINTNKTVGIVFTNKVKFKMPNIRINGELIQFVDSVKMLGITLDKKLIWKTHIQSIIDRCAQCLNLIRLLSGTAFGSSKQSLLSVYRGLIRSRIDYGCFFYQDSSKSNLYLLDTLQYKSLLLCTGGMRGTSLSSLLSECCETSLSHRRHEYYLKFLNRIWFTKHSPCRTALNDLTLTTLNKKFKSTDLLYFNQVLHECNIDSNNLMLWDNSNLCPPWSDSLVNVDIALYDLLKNVNNLRLKKEATEKHVVENYNEFIHIYVDGSSKDHLNGGFSIIIPSLDVVIANKVNFVASALTVEMIAIYKALVYIKSAGLHKAVIFSDCLKGICSIKQMSNWPTKQANVLLCKKIQEIMILNSNNIVKVCWIPAHVGILYHEMADFHSKIPQTNEIYRFCSPCLDDRTIEFIVEECDVIHNLKSLLRLKWKRLWLQGRVSVEYQTHIGFCEQSFQADNVNRREERIINRLWLFSCGLNAYLFKIGISDTDLCNTCGVLENVEHFLLHCKKHSELFDKLQNKTSEYKIPLKISNILNNNSMLKIITTFVFKHNLCM